MKKALLLVAVALAFTLAAAAQESGTQTTQTTTTTTKTQTKSKKAKAAGSAYQEQEQKESAATEAKEKKTGKEAKGAKEQAVTGCLAAGTEPETYKLTRGKKTVTVTGMDLSQHVGHEVKLTGMYEKSAGAKKGREFKAVNAEHIKDTCNTMTAAGSKSKAKSKSKAPAPPSSK